MKNGSVSCCKAAAVALLLAISALQSAVAAPTTDAVLAGLWQSTNVLKPDIKGTLTLRRSGGHWQAGIAGAKATSAVNGKEVRVDIPVDKGSFVGKYEESSGTVSGHWIQPPPIQLGREVASPVYFEQAEPGTWTGEVMPRASEYTFYLKVSQDEDGTLGAFLRNPDRNYGLQLNPRRLELDGGAVKLLDADGATVVEGAYDPANDALTLYFPETRGGDHVFRRVDDGEASGFFARGRDPGPYEYKTPATLDDGWQTGSLESAGMSPGPIREMIEKEIDPAPESVNGLDVHGLLIARHGRLVFEDYFHGFDRDTPHDSRSASKSMTSMLIGAAIEAGLMDDASLGVFGAFDAGKIPPNPDPRSGGMTLEHLLMMSSGLACDDFSPDSPGQEDRMLNQVEQPDWYRYTLALPVQHGPGEVTAYCSAGANLAAGVLSAATGTPLLELLDTLLARPMGIDRYYAWLQPDGQPYMGGGIHWMPRDFLKFGQLMLDEGSWNGHRILSGEWVEASTAPHKELLIWKYGYFWWQLEYQFGDQSIKAYFASGNGGQFLVVIPGLDMVVAFLGGNYGDLVFYRLLREFIPAYILRTVKN